MSDRLLTRARKMQQMLAFIAADWKNDCRAIHTELRLPPLPICDVCGERPSWHGRKSRIFCGCCTDSFGRGSGPDHFYLWQFIHHNGWHLPFPESQPRKPGGDL